MEKKIVIRPSSLATFVSCPQQWYKVFIEGVVTIPNSRAVLGTSIHAAIEAMWNEAIETGDKENINITMMTDVGVETYDTHIKNAEGKIVYDDGFDDNYARDSIVKGTKSYVSGVVPFTPIPESVETRFTVKIDHKMVESISGTVDYIGHNTIADIKTSKRKIIPQSYSLQQSMYKVLAEKNGYTVDKNHIQGIVFNAKTTSSGIDDVVTNTEQVKFITNNLLDRLDALYSGVDPNLLFAGNPKHYLCSEKYCSLHATCPFVNGQK